MVSGSATAGRTLVKRLLTHEARNARDPGDAAAAAGAVCQKLYVEIGQFIGPEGFKVLLGRALYLARPEFSFLEAVRIGDSDDGWFVGLRENVAERDEADISEGIAAVLGGFIDLLGTFIGYDLAFRMIHRCWPDLPRGPHAGNEGKRDG
jgi:hypothetical protein